MTFITKEACICFYDNFFLYEKIYFKGRKITVLLMYDFFRFFWYVNGTTSHTCNSRSIQLDRHLFFSFPNTSGSLSYIVIFIKPHSLSSKRTASSNIIPQVSFYIFFILRYTGAGASATYRQHISSLWLTLTNARLNDLSFCANQENQSLLTKKKALFPLSNINNTSEMRRDTQDDRRTILLKTIH